MEIKSSRNRVNFQILAYLLTIDLLYGTGVRFTTRCRALTAGLSLTLNLTTNSTIPVSQPLSCVSLSCANLSLSLTLQISQWSSSIETTSSDYRFSGVNRELQVLNVSGFIKFKSKHQSFSQADHI